MTTIDTLMTRNEAFAAHQFIAGLPVMPTLRTMIISCVDPRVDPAHVLGLKSGEAVVIRNIGGRITPTTLHTIAMLGTIAHIDGMRGGERLTLIVLQHTDCGITRLDRKPDMLATYFGIRQAELDAKAVSDPWAAVAADVAALKANPVLPPTWSVSGLVYNVTTGLVDPVTRPDDQKEHQRD